MPIHLKIRLSWQILVKKKRTTQKEAESVNSLTAIKDTELVVKKTSHEETYHKSDGFINAVDHIFKVQIIPKFPKYCGWYRKKKHFPIQFVMLT